MPENEWAIAALAAAKPLLPEQPPPDPHAPDLSPSPMPTASRTFWSTAGFSDVGIEKFDGVMDLGRTRSRAASRSTNLMGPTSRALAVDEATRTRVKDAIASVTGALANSRATEHPRSASPAGWSARALEAAREPDIDFQVRRRAVEADVEAAIELGVVGIGQPGQRPDRSCTG